MAAQGSEALQSFGTNDAHASLQRTLASRELERIASVRMSFSI
jgi:hypothetical protein